MLTLFVQVHEIQSNSYYEKAIRWTVNGIFRQLEAIR